MLDIKIQPLISQDQADTGNSARKLQELQEVAEKFEALFVEELLKSSRDSSLASGLFDSEHSDTYKSMLHREYAISVATNTPLGIAEALTDQFSNRLR
ncbi:rod-binding protein [Planktomarina temperata]|jgi:peptidoglycan hydrolase FlgJ|nr:rod-binding protein [bacterium]MDA9912622.1 rod-binding protein [Planktomarina temperata]MDC1094600.1 rod-binding protein [Planktomarina temperata]